MRQFKMSFEAKSSTGDSPSKKNEPRTPFFAFSRSSSDLFLCSTVLRLHRKLCAEGDVHEKIVVIQIRLIRKATALSSITNKGQLCSKQSFLCNDRINFLSVVWSYMESDTNTICIIFKTVHLCCRSTKGAREPDVGDVQQVIMLSSVLGAKFDRALFFQNKISHRASLA